MQQQENPVKSSCKTVHLTGSTLVRGLGSFERSSNHCYVSASFTKQACRQNLNFRYKGSWDLPCRARERLVWRHRGALISVAIKRQQQAEPSQATGVGFHLNLQSASVLQTQLDSCFILENIFIFSSTPIKVLRVLFFKNNSMLYDGVKTPFSPGHALLRQTICVWRS